MGERPSKQLLPDLLAAFASVEAIDTRRFDQRVEMIERLPCSPVATPAKLAMLSRKLNQARSKKDHPVELFWTHLWWLLVGHAVADYPLQSDAILKEEAFYSIACDYNLAHYLLWPLYRDGTKIDEPFAPYFELWARGAKAIFEKPGRVTVYVAGDT